MTRAQLLLAFSTIASSAALLPGSDCDCPKPSQRASCKCVQDDRGLLDVVDAAAGRVHQDMRDCVKEISKMGKSPKKPECGCGMERPSCDCYTCTQTESAVMMESSTTLPMAQPSHNRHPDVDVPPSLKVPQPVPDSQINPFTDEPARSGQSRVRGRTIQYRSNNPGAHTNSNTKTAPRTTYGQQYNSQAQRTTSNADYWAESDQRRPLQLVAPASNEAPNVESAFRAAYRVSLKDSDGQAASNAQSLRPVPNQIRTSSDSITEPSSDPYERDTSAPTIIYDNPLRR